MLCFRRGGVAAGADTEDQASSLGAATADPDRAGLARSSPHTHTCMRAKQKIELFTVRLVWFEARRTKPLGSVKLLNKDLLTRKVGRAFWVLLVIHFISPSRL